MIDVETFRHARRSTDLAPYEVLTAADWWSPDARRAAEETMRSGWSVDGLPSITLLPPLDWDGVCGDNRAWAFNLHSWDALSPILATVDATGDEEHLRFAVDLAVDWARQFPDARAPSPFAWYDMAIGLRAYRLGYLLDVAARRDSVSDAEVDVLRGTVDAHLEVLADDARFAAHSNHGIYFATGQAALARRFPELAARVGAAGQSRARLRELLDAHFTSEGVHREHSPDYHRMVLETLQGLVDARLVDDDLAARCARIEEALAWFVLPNGTLAMFGDTPRRQMSGSTRRGSEHPALRFVATRGTDGHPPDDAVRVFPESGYVVIRDGWPGRWDDPSEWSYLAQTAAFHSRVHKHADDLSFVWFDRGHELLVDAGRYGYLGRTAQGSRLWQEGHWYDDPNRVFVESTRAHNTVEIDDRSLPRTGVEPYGSAIIDWSERGGVHATRAEATHRGVRHRRLLLFRPREWLVVVDWLDDASGAGHAFTQRFQVAPELRLHGRPPTPSFAVPGTAAHLHVVSLDGSEPVDAVRGEREPELHGWISREDGEMTPTWTVGFRAQGSSHAFATLLAFGDASPHTTSASFGAGDWTADLGWHGDAVGTRVVVTASRRGVRVDHRVRERS